MDQKIKAVTVTKDYLNKKIWVVKLLSVFNRKDGTPYWRVAKVIDSDPDYMTASNHALHYCIEKKVAYVASVKHGQNLTELHKEILAVFDKAKK